MSNAAPVPSYNLDLDKELIAVLQSRVDYLLANRNALLLKVLSSDALDPDDHSDRVIVSNRTGAGPFPLVYCAVEDGWIAQWDKNTKPFDQSLPWSLNFWLNDWTISYAS